MYLEQRFENLESQVLKELREVKEMLLQSQSISKQPQELELMTVAKAAKYIERSEGTIRNYVASGELTKYDGLGRYKIMLSKQELDKIKESGLSH